MKSTAELDAIFGAGPQEDARGRALASDRLFVRSQMQLAEDSAAAKGRRMTAVEALDAFGYDALATVAYDGRFHLYATSHEPSRTLRANREALGLDIATLAMRACLTPAEIEKAETVGEISPYRTLQAIAAALGLDTLTLGVAHRADG